MFKKGDVVRIMDGHECNYPLPKQFKITSVEYCDEKDSECVEGGCPGVINGECFFCDTGMIIEIVSNNKWMGGRRVKNRR